MQYYGIIFSEMQTLIYKPVTLDVRYCWVVNGLEINGSDTIPNGTLQNVECLRMQFSVLTILNLYIIFYITKWYVCKYIYEIVLIYIDQIHLHYFAKWRYIVMHICNDYYSIATN